MRGDRRMIKRLKLAVKDALAYGIAGALPGRVMKDKRYFPLWERHGFHVLPAHFYEPVPVANDLPEGLWSHPTTMPGIRMDAAPQLALLAEFTLFKAEYDALPHQPTGVPGRFHLDNPSFRSVDAEALYCMIRRFRPRRVLEIGSGNSTFLAAQAILKNRDEDGLDCDLTAIEPYPREELRKGLPGLTRLMATPVQQVPLSEFESLGKDDILFIDSSHVLKIGSDVQYEYLEILPRLKPGVLIHVHDVFLPAEYPRKWVKDHHVFWNEQYLLQAFLAFNSHFEIIFAGSFLHMQHPDRLESAFASYRRDKEWPGSFWMRRVQPG